MRIIRGKVKFCYLVFIDLIFFGSKIKESVAKLELVSRLIPHINHWPYTHIIYKLQILFLICICGEVAKNEAN